jgi:predicted acetyltransferase
MLYGFLDGVIIGRCSVRHDLNDFLREFGGHFGYGVAPQFRGRGFGSQLFQAGREHLKSLGRDRAFMTYGSDNQASLKMSEDAGGIFKTSPLIQAIRAPRLGFGCRFEWHRYRPPQSSVQDCPESCDDRNRHA